MATVTFTDTENERIKVDFPYSESLVRLIKNVQGRQWHPDGKYWTIPRSPIALKQSIQAFSGHSILIDPDLPQFSSLISQSNSNPSQQTAPPGRSAQPVPQAARRVVHDMRGTQTDRRVLQRPPLADRRDRDFAAALLRQLRIRNYSPRTIKLYKNVLLDFSHFFSKPIDTLVSDDIALYLDTIITQRHVSASRVSQVISTLKFFYEKVLSRKDITITLEHPRKDKKLPHILDREDVLAILNAVHNPKHRLMLEIMYSSGMRVSEVARVRVRDIDLNSLALSVRAGKGHKDRITMISEKSLDLIKILTSGKNADDFLFHVSSPDRPTSARTIQHIFNTALLHSGIKKHATCHTFRHSFATHLMESGTALPYIKDLLGHSSIKTTEIYTHIRRPHISKIKSPL